MKWSSQSQLRPMRWSLPSVGRAGSLVGVMFVMMMMTITICVPMASGFHLADPVNKIGASTTIGINGLNQLASEALPLLIAQVRQAAIPDQSGRADTPVGHIDYDITEMKINSININKLAFSLDPAKSAVRIDASGIEVNLQCKWHYKKKSFPPISDGGHADIKSSDSSAVIVVSLSTVNAKPHVDVLNADVSLANFNIDLHGGTSWLYNLFVSLFKGDVKHAIEKGMSDATRTNIDKGVNKFLSSFPDYKDLDKWARWSFPFTGPIIVTAQGITFNILSEFYDRHNPTEFPDTPAALPGQLSDSMIQVSISDFTFNSAGFVYDAGGALVVTISQNDLPPTVPIHLNTSDFKFIIPQLYSTFPDAAMQIVLAADPTPYPRVQIVASQGGHMAVSGSVELRAFEDSAFKSALTLAVNASIDVTSCAVQGGNLTFALALGSMTFALRDSQVGPIPPAEIAGLQTLMNIFGQAIVKAIMERFGAQGIPIPVFEGIDLANAKVSFGDDFLVVVADIHYHPTRGESMFGGGAHDVSPRIIRRNP